MGYNNVILIDNTTFGVAAVESESPGQGNSYLPGIGAVSDGAQTGPQRPRIGSVRIGSGGSALGPE
jgi:hypothetical protein